MFYGTKNKLRFQCRMALQSPKRQERGATTCHVLHRMLPHEINLITWIGDSESTNPKEGLQRPASTRRNIDVASYRDEGIC